MDRPDDWIDWWNAAGPFLAIAVALAAVWWAANNPDVGRWGE